MMKIFIGLGNPGKEYENTRHNFGFMAVDAIAEDNGFGPYKSKFRGQVAEGKIGDVKVIILKPNTYMNLSGGSAVEAMRFFKIPLEDVVVFHDDIDLPLGEIRDKVGGGTGGHNGLKDLDKCIGREYRRFRLGVGHPGHKDMVSDYVLHKFSKQEMDTVKNVIVEVVQLCRRAL